MANFSIKADLLKLQGAFVSDIKGSTATKHCICIPIAEAGLFEGEKGVYLNITGVAMQEARYSDTHFLRVNVDRAKYDAMTEEQRKAIPIIGGMHELGGSSQQQPKQQQTPAERARSIAAAQQAERKGDDLPF
ncbi:MAG: hypothetical protein MJY71_02535 [Bacteroidaceae bacterium]|nr:hypothetical protein [Bacteroidaceae bacterium]